jgi:hypothetical protein
MESIPQMRYGPWIDDAQQQIMQTMTEVNVFCRKTEEPVSTRTGRCTAAIQQFGDCIKQIQEEVDVREYLKTQDLKLDAIPAPVSTSSASEKLKPAKEIGNLIERSIGTFSRHDNTMITAWDAIKKQFEQLKREYPSEKGLIAAKKTSIETMVEGNQKSITHLNGQKTELEAQVQKIKDMKSRLESGEVLEPLPETPPKTEPIKTPEKGQPKVKPTLLTKRRIVMFSALLITVVTTLYLLHVLNAQKARIQA